MEMKERIKTKANELFMRYGIRSVTMDEIATQLGISKKTIYQLFTDKDDIVCAVIEEHLDSSEHDCLSCKEDAENAIHEIFLAIDRVTNHLRDIHPAMVFDLHKFHYEAFRKLQAFKNEFLLSGIEDNLKRGISEGLYRPGIHIEVLSRFRLESIYFSLNPNVFPPETLSSADIHMELMIHFLFGLSTPKGYKLIETYLNDRKKQHHDNGIL